MRRIAPVLIAALLSLSLATTPPAPAVDPVALEALLASVRGLSLQGRILGLSAQFLGTPYAHSPLGEGEGPDPDPRLRLDRMDCLTFVETVMALALSSSVEDVVHVLDSIRYRSRPDYAGRNHLMEAEWLPSNAAKGLVRDVTLELGGEAARPGWKVIGPEAWASTTARGLALPPEARPTGRFPLPLLPVDAVAGRAGQWPSGTLLLLVREDAPWRITRVSHLGFVVQRGGKTYLRHATRGWKDGVVDEELAHLLARHARYSWKIAGVSLWEVRDPRPRTEAVSATAP
ncbi:MAG: N-acetylmuramoyl-L-alanine amidase-like domain-containing protein [Myxococcaceae bacterium]